MGIKKYNLDFRYKNLKWNRSRKVVISKFYLLYLLGIENNWHSNRNWLQNKREKKFTYTLENFYDPLAYNGSQ